MVEIRLVWRGTAAADMVAALGKPSLHQFFKWKWGIIYRVPCKNTWIYKIFEDSWFFLCLHFFSLLFQFSNAIILRFSRVKYKNVREQWLETVCNRLNYVRKIECVTLFTFCWSFKKKINIYIYINKNKGSTSFISLHNFAIDISCNSVQTQFKNV
jgi:hypothetical protein